MLLRSLVFAIIAFFYAETALAAENKSPWQFEAGIAASRPTPIMLNAGVGYENVFFRVAGGGMYLGSNEFWVGYRGNLAWKFFREHPFSLDLGISGGYAFAKAPNEIHRALNKANKKLMVRPYNYKESLDISADIRANIFGVFTEIAIPIHYFMKHDEPTIIWQIGYAYKF